MSSWVNLLDALYPIGSIYFNIESISPATTIGGTWTQLTGGCLACAGSDGYASSGAIGGSKKISIAQMPSHGHPLLMAYQDSNLQTGIDWTWDANGNWQWDWDGTNSNGRMGRTGNGEDYIPYHTSVYVWKRTA